MCNSESYINVIIISRIRRSGCIKLDHLFQVIKLEINAVDVKNDFCAYAPDCSAFCLPWCLFRLLFFIVLWVTGVACFENFPGGKHWSLKGREFWKSDLHSSLCWTGLQILFWAIFWCCSSVLLYLTCVEVRWPSVNYMPRSDCDFIAPLTIRVTVIVLTCP